MTDEEIVAGVRGLEEVVRRCGETQARVQSLMKELEAAKAEHVTTSAALYEARLGVFGHIYGY